MSIISRYNLLNYVNNLKFLITSNTFDVNTLTFPVQNAIIFIKQIHFYVIESESIMDKDKKILLYRIDEQAKNVIFVVTADNKTAWENISEEKRTVISFDDIFRDITEFRGNFLDYEKLTDELIGAINGRGVIFRELLERFDDYQLNSFNFFTRYYSDTLRDVFITAREDIEKAGALFNTRALKKSTEYVHNVFDNIREVMRDDWNFDFNSEGDLQAFRVSFDKVIIRGNDINEIYTIADISLVNFFYDLSFAIHKLKLYVCKCKYCTKKFLGDKNSVCCDAEECQATYQREIKNAKRRNKEKEPYKKPIVTITNYIGQAMYNLRAAVQDDPDIIAEFEDSKKIFKKKIKDMVADYEADHRSTDDKEMKQFIKSLEGEISMCKINLIAKYQSRQ